jgi:hypothetical protein
MWGQADVPVHCIPSADDFLGGAWHDRFDRSEPASTDASIRRGGVAAVDDERIGAW